MLWDIYLGNKKIDMVWFDKNCTQWDVKNSLINHDNYHPNIKVICCGKTYSNNSVGVIKTGLFGRPYKVL
jgi:hypothetical protein